jgi:hypothetical protein
VNVFDSKKIILSCTIFLILASNCGYSQQQSDENKEEALENGKILKFLEGVRLEKQSGILSFEDLPGTYWTPDDMETYPWAFPYGYIFLNDLVIIVMVDIHATISNYTFSSIRSVEIIVKYKIEEEKIFVTKKLSCYLKDTYLYFGNETDGYNKASPKNNNYTQFLNHVIIIT